MTRAVLEAYIGETYNTGPDYPWEDTPDGAVFRHGNNKKWFAVILRVKRDRLGLPGPGDIDVVNLKCDPLMLGSMLLEPGFFPAYHMSKAHWISAALDGSAEDEKIKLALDVSFELTETKIKRRGSKGDAGSGGG